MGHLEDTIGDIRRRNECETRLMWDLYWNHRGENPQLSAFVFFTTTYPEQYARQFDLYWRGEGHRPQYKGGVADVRHKPQ
jgi:hypothetical protein